MTWIKFTLWLSGSYTAYYAALILWDFIRNGRKPAGSDTHELTFVEHIEPARAEIDTVPEFYPSAVISSGGQSLKQIFNLAKEEVIEFTRGVSF
jgi:hypothetical protein